MNEFGAQTESQQNERLEGSLNNNRNGDVALPSTLTQKKKKLAQIHEHYEEFKMTPQQRLAKEKAANEHFYQMFPGLRAMGQSVLPDTDAIIAKNEEENPRDKIFSETFTLEGRQVTVTTESKRHWREATEEDCGSIVYHTTFNEFGEFDDTDLESDEEFPEVKNTTAIVYSFSGNQRTEFEYDGKFDSLLVVPEEVLTGVNNEAPPGRIFSGKSITDSSLHSTWSPAPEGKVWFQHPFIKNPNGVYLSYEEFYYLTNLINRNTYRDQSELWRERGSLAYWCPVLKRFISEGERLGQEHWFHNGDGSAQQRYFYDQNEMLDRNGGLESLPLAISRCTGEFNVQPFLQMDLALIPHVLAWMAHGCSAESDSCGATPLYQFLRNLPLFIDFRGAAAKADSKPSPVEPMTKKAKHDTAR